LAAFDQKRVAPYPIQHFIHPRRFEGQVVIDGHALVLLLILVVSADPQTGGQVLKFFDKATPTDENANQNLLQNTRQKYQNLNILESRGDLFGTVG
jgi:hypothetical protein